MIDRRELESALKSILDAFPGGFNPARMERIAAVMSGLSASDIRRVAQHLVDVSRYAPLPEDFKRAISDLGVKRALSSDYVPPRTRRRIIEIAHLEGDWFFNEDYVFNRASSVKDLARISIADHPDHPLVATAKKLREECLAGRKKYIRTIEAGRPHYPAEVYDFFYGPRRRSLENGFAPLPEATT